MEQRLPPQLEMTADGRFRDLPRPSLGLRIGRTAMIAAVVSGVLATALLALWFALMLIPFAIGAALVAWITFKLRGGPMPRR